MLSTTGLPQQKMTVGYVQIWNLLETTFHKSGPCSNHPRALHSFKWWIGHLQLLVDFESEFPSPRWNIPIFVGSYPQSSTINQHKWSYQSAHGFASYFTALKIRAPEVSTCGRAQECDTNEPKTISSDLKSSGNPLETLRKSYRNQFWGHLGVLYDFYMISPIIGVDNHSHVCLNAHGLAEKRHVLIHLRRLHPWRGHISWLKPSLLDEALQNPADAHYTFGAYHRASTFWTAKFS